MPARDVAGATAGRAFEMMDEQLATDLGKIEDRLQTLQVRL